MNRKKLKKLRQQIDILRRHGGVKTRELEELAKALGRKRHKRGNEPTWVSEELRGSYPISIPSHTTDLNKFTARNILNQLESDLDELEEIYAHEEQEDPDDETIQQED
jgi:hypothetical protein